MNTTKNPHGKINSHSTCLKVITIVPSRLAEAHSFGIRKQWLSHLVSSVPVFADRYFNILGFHGVVGLGD